MARNVVNLTDTWQQVATAQCVIRTREVPPRGRALSINEAADDATAMADITAPGDQYVQNEAKPTFAKGEGITITVDTAG